MKEKNDCNHKGAFKEENVFSNSVHYCQGNAGILDLYSVLCVLFVCVSVCIFFVTETSCHV